MSDLTALLLVAIGIASLVVWKRRRFDRINKYGVERFPSFSAKLRGRWADHVLVGGGAIAIAAGTIGTCNNHFDSWGWIVMLPASW